MSVAAPPQSIQVAVERAVGAGFWNYFLAAANGAMYGRRVSLTSWWRSRAHNAAVGGAPGSQHQIGTAFDLVGPDARAAIPALRAAGFGYVLDEGDHIHVQAWAAAPHVTAFVQSVSV